MIKGKLLPVLTIILAIVAIWYAMTVVLNAKWTYDQAARAGVEVSFSELVADTMGQERPVLPAPHQVAAEIWKTTAEQNVTSRRSLVYHGWVTLSATLLGFAIGTALGISIAIGIVYSRVMDGSVMPWVIASQTIPILAIAPMVVVMFNSMGVTGLLPKAVISAYLSFFPVTVGMVKGLRAPEGHLLDLMKTYNASGLSVLWKLRLPASMPYLFASLKIAMAASLVGAIVGEMPTGAKAGFGARLLVGSQFGQPLTIWSALIGAAVLAGLLLVIISIIQSLTLKRMGMAQ
ncbi:ABC transporter permease [Abyssibius alkaniclasticus]|uniref:ABC transporter permease n=1 Tax=Abyssibius alkaniclasticus TaxID=2881234 RepID=UPI00405934FB